MFTIIERPGGVPVKAWIEGLAVEDAAMQQLMNVASLPIVKGWVAAMPDVHYGIGATVGSVIPTEDAIIPAAVGVDIGCGMIAVQTTLRAGDLPDSLRDLRTRVERVVPHGLVTGRRDPGSWTNPPAPSLAAFAAMEPGFVKITEKHPKIKSGRTVEHLGTLGTGNHFIEVCIDEADFVWVMLHSGSRGVGNRIGTYFIELARNDMKKHIKNLPDRDLAYFEEGSDHFNDYVFAVGWAQDFARRNRELMLVAVLDALKNTPGVRPFQLQHSAVNCHHNYVARERHRGRDLLITRKGAVRAGRGDMGIIPGSMGACSYIVRGLGNPDSYESCSHGAGRSMSRTAARKLFTIEDHRLATKHVECRKDEGVIDETPAAYKNIDTVMRAQSDLVEIVHTLRQVLCVKG